MTVHTVGLGRHQHRSDFDCGEPQLHAYLQRVARQQAQQDSSRTYAAEPVDGPAARTASIQGFHAISAGSLDVNLMTHVIRRAITAPPLQ